jgi:UV DNA damage endonuclease
MNSTNTEQAFNIPSNFNLGYACINMTLRKQPKKDPVFMSRTVRLSTIEKKGIDYVKSLAIQNCKDILTMLKWNKEHNIFFMRLSSEIFPFATHPQYGYSIDFAESYLKEAGNYAKQNCIRLTFHPSQFNVLSSPNEIVVRNTFLDLNHHSEILDRMGLGKDSVIIVHGGGVYGNKEKALERLEKNIALLPENTRNRLVLENCEMSYCLTDLLPVSEKLKVPIVIDFHHDSIYPSEESVEFYFDRVFKVWFDRGIKPKVHVSNSVPGITKDDSKTARRKHSDYISFLHDSLLTITFPIDIMLECKMKEQAIFRLLDETKKN